MRTNALLGIPVNERDASVLDCTVPALIASAKHHVDRSEDVMSHAMVGRKAAMGLIALIGTTLAACEGELPTPPPPDAHASTADVRQTDSADAQLMGNFAEILEPGGMTPLVNFQGGSTNLPGFPNGSTWQSAVSAGSIAVVSDAASKFGNTLERRAQVGQGSTWFPGGGNTNNNFNHRELYIRFVYKLSSNWQFHGSAEKLYLYGRKIGTGQPTQFVLVENAGSIRFAVQNVASGGGEIAGGSAVSATFRANGFGAPARDVYHTIEILHRMNTPGVADGSLRMAIDGVEVDSWTRVGTSNNNINLKSGVMWNGPSTAWTAPEFTGWQGFMFWGGQGSTKAVNDAIGLSELYISGRNDAAPGCLIAEDDHVWVNQNLASQTGTFTLEFDASVSQSPTDALIGFSDGAAGTYADLATIVRFHADGNIDARDGGAYDADVVLPYTAGTSYHFRLEVDVNTHTYSVLVTPAAGTEIALATNYAFRTEQAGATQLNNLGSYIDTGFSGSVETCNLTVS